MMRASCWKQLEQVLSVSYQYPRTRTERFCLEWEDSHASLMIEIVGQNAIPVAQEMSELRAATIGTMRQAGLLVRVEMTP
jgi:hypothetical protein